MKYIRAANDLRSRKDLPYNFSDDDMIFLFVDILKTDDNSTLQEM